MSTGKHRKEQNCLNCGAIVHGPFCSFCGQENLENNESLWHIILHFLNDITHFDGRMFTTLKLLLRKPGFLSSEYTKGRRTSYLHPIRLYVFTSALFFLVVFWRTNGENAKTEATRQATAFSQQYRDVQSALARKNTPLQRRLLSDSLSRLTGKILTAEAAGLIPRSDLISDSVRNRLLPGLEQDMLVLNLNGKSEKSSVAYDSAQALLPARQRDNFLTQYFTRKAISLNEAYQGRKGELLETFKEGFMHSLPKMMLISLPFSAGLLWLLYRRRKAFSFVNHGILTLHNYVATYLLILLFFGASWLDTATHWMAFNWLKMGIGFFILFYDYFAMRRFYGQSWKKTLLKYFVFLFLNLIVFVFLSFIFVVNTFLQLH